MAMTGRPCASAMALPRPDRKSTRLNSSHDQISYAVFCLKKKTVSVDVPVAIPGVGISPREHEHLLAVADQVLDKAPVGREIGDLVLVDHRFFFNDTATTEIYTLSLHDALPIAMSLGLASVLTILLFASDSLASL